MWGWPRRIVLSPRTWIVFGVLNVWFLIDGRLESSLDRAFALALVVVGIGAWQTLRARARARRVAVDAVLLRTAPVNVAGLAFYDVEEISVNEFHTRPDGEGDSEQVHVMLKLERVEHPIVMRFKSPPTLDQFIVALITHRRRVWGGNESTEEGQR